MVKLRSRAFTLVESLVAVSIVALIAIAFFSSLLTSVNFVRRSFELRTASLILQEQLSIVRNLEYSEVQAIGSSFSSGYMSPLKNAAGTIYKSYYNGSNRILKITFKLGWTSFINKTMEKSVVTLITDHGINKQ